VIRRFIDVTGNRVVPLVAEFAGARPHRLGYAVEGIGPAILLIPQLCSRGLLDPIDDAPVL
jgi:hypothetical protein